MSKSKQPASPGRGGRRPGVGHYYADDATIRHSGYSDLAWDTVSVGVCPVLANSKGQPKLGAAVVRIAGPNTEEGIVAINRLAEIVAAQMKDGNYDGPKNLNIDSPYAMALKGQGK